VATASPFVLAPVAAAVAAEITTLHSAIANFEADIAMSSFAGMIAGSPAPTLWPVFLSQESDAAQIAT
jgi:hypothetical protein